MSKDISYLSEGHDSCFAVEDNSFWFILRNRLIAFFISKYTSATENFHDVGGGNGYVSKMIQNDLGLNVCMVEPGEVGCQNASRRGVRNVLKATFSEIDGSTTVCNVGLFDVIEHIENPAPFLEKIRGRMQSGGKVFATVPAYQWLWSDEDVLAGHFRRYSKAQIEDDFRKAGFQVMEVVPFFSLLILPIFLFRTLPLKFGLKRKSTFDQDLVKQGLGDKIISTLLSAEIALIKRGFKLPIGASILIVAKKI